jgi:thiol-disulfide isomerase/thioredoxin
MIAGFVLVGAALVAGAAMLLMAGGEPKQQPAPLLMAVAGEIFPAAEPKPGPELRFVDGADQPRTLADFRGKVVLLNLWATWCVPCREEMPALDRLQARLGGPDFEVVARSNSHVLDRSGCSAFRS